MDTYFYKCTRCGNIIVKIKDSGITPFCCGSSMEQLRPETSDAMTEEKHVPVCEIVGRKLKVSIGSVEHPHTQEHHIEWIYVQTNMGGYLRYLSPEQKPEAKFKLAHDEEVEAVYCYCNIHGFWMCDCANVVIFAEDSCNSGDC